MGGGVLFSISRTTCTALSSCAFCLFIDLREEIAIEIAEPATGCIGKIDVRDPSTCDLIHLAPVVLDPRKISQVCFVLQRDDCYFTRSGTIISLARPPASGIVKSL
jgi:hypothetical protein